jgi:hypothetical protein
MSKGYLQAVETLRNRLMASEWELGLRPIALQVWVASMVQGQGGGRGTHRLLSRRSCWVTGASRVRVVVAFQYLRGPGR